MIYLIGPHFYMDFQTYLTHPGINKSKLDSIAKSPLHYWSRWIDPNFIPPAPTPAMEFGTALHTAVLEPERFQIEYAQAPDVSRTTKAGKEAWAEAAEGGKKLLKTDEWWSVQYMLRSIMEHPMARKILNARGVSEQSLFAVCPHTGLELKCRADFLTASGWIIDLKSTQDASVSGFQRSVASFRYHVQAAHYLNVCRLATGEAPRGFAFIAVEKTAPFAVQVFEASPELIKAGGLEAMRNLRAIESALKTYPPALPWPSYSEEMVQLHPPTWMTPSLPEM
jgi:hypothetical protein